MLVKPNSGLLAKPSGRVKAGHGSEGNQSGHSSVLPRKASTPTDEGNKNLFSQYKTLFRLI